MPQYFELQEQILQDPEVAQMTEVWSSCMANKGYDYQDSQVARGSFRQQAETLFARLEARAGLDTPDFPGLFDQEVEAAAAEGREPFDLSFEPIDFASLEEVEDSLQDEKAVAKADAICMQPLDERWNEIRRDYELRYVDENRAELDALAASTD